MEMPSSSMPSAISAMDIEPKAGCPICLGYLIDPVTLDCGHNFCQACITDYCEMWEELGDLKCPVCRAPIEKGNFRSNWQLADIVEMLRHHPLKQTKKTLCVKHKKELNLFCRVDEEFVCVVCERSPEHRSHSVLLLEEAAQEYKEKIKGWLKILRERKGNSEEQNWNEELKNMGHMTQLDVEKQNIRTAFDQMYKFLQEQEQVRLTQLEELEKAIEERQEKNVTQLSEEISRLGDLIIEMEGKCQQPANEFLQDIRSTLSSRGKWLPESWNASCRETSNLYFTVTLRLSSDIRQQGIPSPRQGRDCLGCSGELFLGFGWKFTQITQVISSNNKATKRPLSMAVSPQPDDMDKEVMCPICMEYLADPVSVDCGHNFCRGCITDFCEKWREYELLKCPICRVHIQEENFRPNWQLANIVTRLKFLSLKEKLCEKHQEKLKLFCKADEQLVCLMCERSPEHKQHSMVLLEEAAQEYKEKIKAQLKSLEEEKEILVPQKLAEEIASQKTLAQIEVEKRKIRSAFHRMHNFLEEKEDFWLAQLEDLEKEIKKNLKDNITRISQKITSISYLTGEMKEKCQQPESEFLQNIKSTMRRYEKKPTEPVVDHIPGMEDRLQLCFQKNSALENAMGKFAESLDQDLNKEALEQTLKKGARKKTLSKGSFKLWNKGSVHKASVKQALNKVKVILDPSTVHPSLLLSDDLKSVRWEDKFQPLPDSPERFECMPCVLGCEKFSSGKHWWEVEVKEEEERAMWALGVAKESVARKKEIHVSVDEGIFAAGKTSVLLPCQLSAFTSPKATPLILRHPLRKILVSLDYEEGQVGFYDAETNEWIFTFHSASFSGEKVRPYFWMGRGVKLKC